MSLLPNGGLFPILFFLYTQAQIIQLLNTFIIFYSIFFILRNLTIYCYNDSIMLKHRWRVSKTVKECVWYIYEYYFTSQLCIRYYCLPAITRINILLQVRILHVHFLEHQTHCLYGSIQDHKLCHLLSHCSLYTKNYVGPRIPKEKKHPEFGAMWCDMLFCSLTFLQHISSTEEKRNNYCVLDFSTSQKN